MSSETLLAADAKMRKAIEALRKELGAIRTGHATPALVEHIRVDYGEAPTPLNQLATISTPEARLIIVRPWDKGALNSITKALLKSDLGLNPINDGNVIRLAVPSPTEERRLELVKMVRKRIEEGKVALRNIRREAMEELKRSERNKETSQDEHHRISEQLQKITDSFITDAEQIGENKEKEVMEF